MQKKFFKKESASDTRRLFFADAIFEPLSKAKSKPKLCEKK